jgi:hypothetical protein
VRTDRPRLSSGLPVLLKRELVNPEMFKLARNRPASNAQRAVSVLTRTRLTLPLRSCSCYNRTLLLCYGVERNFSCRLVSQSFVRWVSRVIRGWAGLGSPNPSSRTVPLVSTQPLAEMSTRNLPGSKGRQARKADNLTAVCEPIV